MSYVYTKNGRPLPVSDDKVLDASGCQVGRIRGRKVFNSSGRYVGTIVDGDRLVYRSTDSASLGSPFAPSIGSPSARASQVASAAWGDEPRL